MIEGTGMSACPVCTCVPILDASSLRDCYNAPKRFSECVIMLMWNDWQVGLLWLEVGLSAQHSILKHYCTVPYAT